MTYKMYIMNFQSAHFGAGTLDSSKMTFAADRLFSALAIEAKKNGENGGIRVNSGSRSFCFD